MSEPIHVLHVEDEPAFASLVETFLDRYSQVIQVSSVGTVAKARDRIQEGWYDCIVSDFDLPDETGLSLLRWLRDQGDDVPFILCTAKGSEEVASQAISAGVTDYLQKKGGGEQYELLAHRIENVVSRARTEHQFAELDRINDVVREISQGLVGAASHAAIDELICERLAASFPYACAWIGELDPAADGIHPRMSAGIDVDGWGAIPVEADIDRLEPDGPSSAPPQARSSSDAVGALARAVTTGELQVVESVSHDRSFATWPETIERDHHSIAVIPLVHRDRSYGLLVVHADRKRAFGERERGVLEELGDTVANAYYSVEMHAELETSERNYREVFDKVNDAIFVHDIETGEIVDVNEKTCEMLGYDREETLGLTVGDFSTGEPPYTQANALEWIRKAAEDGPQLFEWAARDRSDDPFWMEVNLKRAVIGGHDRMLAVVRDVTERKEMEATLTDTRRKIEGLLEAASQMEACETVSEVYEMVVSTAERILSFDVCGINVPREGYFDIVAASEEMTPAEGHRIPVGEGIVGAAYRRGEPLLVDDVQASADAQPGRSEYRSTISVPIGDDAVFQAISSTAGFFDQTDLELARLFASHVKEAVDRVRSRQALEANEEKFRELFHHANDAIFLVDVSGEPTFVEVNDVACQRLGYDRAELLGMHPFDLHPADSPVDVGESVFNAAAATFESVHCTSTGEQIPVEISTHRFSLRGDEVILAIARDVSIRHDRIAILDTLHEATRRLIRAESIEDVAAIGVETARDALDIPLAVALGYDEEADHLEPLAITDELADISGGRTHLICEAGEGPLWDAYVDDERRLFEDGSAIVGLQSPGGDLGQALALPLGRHGLFFIATKATDSFDETAVEFVEILAANIRVALDRASRELQLHEREHELRSQRDQFAALFENIPDPAVASTFAGDEPIVDRVNSAFERVFGYDAEEVLGRNLDDFIVPADPAEDPVRLNRQSTDGTAVRREVRREAVDGVRDFLLHGVPIDVGKPNTRAYGIYTDITEQKEREADLERQNEHLEAFANIVSHDIRNPLSVAQGYLELARETGSDDAFEQIETAHERMERLIEGVLTLAREGRPIGETRSVDLGTIVESAWAHVETAEATLVVESPLGSQSADPDRLSRLFENLFRNAVEHGNSTVTVRVGATPDGFFVADDGPGIPDEGHENLFDYGFTTADDGTGFGLSIVKRIVDGHGWTIDVCEPPNGGTCFEITF